jgi:hypothetical protein
MTRLRFTLAQLMATVIFIGLGFAALRSASLLWASAVFTLTVAVLSAAILGAMARRRRARMTWAGFALFGWIYLGTTFGPWATINGVTAPPYVTRWGLDYWDSKLWSVGRMDSGSSGEELFPRFPIQGMGGGMSGGLVPGPPVTVPLVSPPDAFQFRRIGHCLAAIMFGLIGMVLGRLTAAEAKDRRLADS